MIIKTKPNGEYIELRGIVLKENVFQRGRLEHEIGVSECPQRPYIIGQTFWLKADQCVIMSESKLLNLFLED